MATVPANIDIHFERYKILIDGIFSEYKTLAAKEDLPMSVQGAEWRTAICTGKQAE